MQQWTPGIKIKKPGKSEVKNLANGLDNNIIVS